jgi:tRNA threonylcarbamoyl adenosine modification protein YeaZ
LSFTLAISTSAPALSVALFDGPALLAHDHRVIGRGHAEALVPAVQVLLGGRRPDAIIVDVGPGSYTGIRVGIAAARALGLAWGVPVHGCTAFALVAAQADHAGVITACIDAGRGAVLAARVAADFSEDAPQALPGGSAAPEGPVAGAGLALLAPAPGPVLHEGHPDGAAARLLPASARSLPPVARYGGTPMLRTAASAA